MREMTAADLARIREAVRLRDRCVAAAVEHHRRVGIQPSDVHARAAYDAMAPLIAARVRAQVAEGIAEAIESDDGAIYAHEAAEIARQHAQEVPDAQ